MVKVRVSTETDHTIFEEPVVATSEDEAMQIATRYVRDMIEVTGEDVRDILTPDEMEVKRMSHGNMPEFASRYHYKDKCLPYVFDLLYDIKSECHLLKAMIDGEDFHSLDEIRRTAESNGYSMKYLKDRYHGDKPQ